MTKQDYEELGFKCGIEIHQQLEGKKLFCNCPTIIRKDKPDFEIVRRLRASAGEEGSVDKAALHEQKKQKYFVYQGYNDITCNVELDEEPPHPINTDALRAALQICKMLNCEIIDKIQVMRKTVIDGSNTSGFQRTMLIGLNGFLEANGRKIVIETVCLEEEACQIIERKKDHDVYNLSRLGMPMIEIATAPDMKSPEEVKEVASKLGMILRSTGACKRGIGTIRQDVNLSITGGSRVEIKGFQDLKSIAKVIDTEINRQVKIIMSGKTFEPEVRNTEDDFSTTFLRPMPGTDRMYPETDIPEIIPDLVSIEVVKTIDEKVKELVESFAINQELAAQLINRSIDLYTYAKRYARLEPKFIAEILINSPKEIKARFGKEIDILKHAEQVFEKANSEEIPKSAIFEVLVEIANGKEPDFSKYSAMSEEELEKEIINLVKEDVAAPIQALMGALMAKYRGKIDGKKAMEILRKHKK